MLEPYSRFAANADAIELTGSGIIMYNTQNNQMWVSLCAASCRRFHKLSVPWEQSPQTASVFFLKIENVPVAIHVVANSLPKVAICAEGTHSIALCLSIWLTYTTVLLSYP